MKPWGFSTKKERSEKPEREYDTNDLDDNETFSEH